MPTQRIATRPQLLLAGEHAACLDEVSSLLRAAEPVLSPFHGALLALLPVAALARLFRATKQLRSALVLVLAVAKRSPPQTHETQMQMQMQQAPTAHDHRQQQHREHQQTVPDPAAARASSSASGARIAGAQERLSVAFSDACAAWTLALLFVLRCSLVQLAQQGPQGYGEERKRATADPSTAADTPSNPPPLPSVPRIVAPLLRMSLSLFPFLHIVAAAAACARRVAIAASRVLQPVAVVSTSVKSTATTGTASSLAASALSASVSSPSSSSVTASRTGSRVGPEQGSARRTGDGDAATPVIANKHPATVSAAVAVAASASAVACVTDAAQDRFSPLSWELATFCGADLSSCAAQHISLQNTCVNRLVAPLTCLCG
jgi:hypothetical protein